VRRQPHADSAVREAEDWLAANFGQDNAVAAVVAAIGIPDRSLKRRFKTATGATLIGYVQNLRVEAAKRLLEAGTDSVDAISASVGYENFAFFRRLFKRSTGLTPGQYRRMFHSLAIEGPQEGAGTES
jgi:transcriptional regulator GlxA family with amidase domain